MTEIKKVLEKLRIEEHNLKLKIRSVKLGYRRKVYYCGQLNAVLDQINELEQLLKVTM